MKPPKLLLFIVEDKYFDCKDKEIRDLINNTYGNDKSINYTKMKLSFFKNYGYLTVPCNTILASFIIPKSERHVCENIAYRHLPITCRLDFYYTDNKTNKEEENKTMTIIEERAENAKKTIDDLIKDTKRLRDIEKLFSNDKNAAEYLNKAFKNIDNAGLQSDLEPFVEAIKMMITDINNLQNALTNYIEDYSNNKKELEEYQKMKPVIEHLRAVFKEG